MSKRRVASKKSTKSKPKVTNSKHSKEGYVKHESKNFTYHNFDKENEFEGVYNGECELQKATKKGWADRTNYKFKDMLGNNVIVNGCYAIDEAITEHGKGQYLIIFKGAKRLKGKQTLKEFDIFFKKLTNKKVNDNDKPF